MRVAITGPTGSIGSELVEELIAEGNEVIAIVRPGSCRIKNMPVSDAVKIIECDVSNYKSLLGQDRCDLFYHLAWSGTTVDSRNNPISQADNTLFSLDAVSLAKDWGAKKFIGVGSQAEYGPCNHPLTTSTPINPISAYGLAKATAYRLCGAYCKSNGLEFNWTRVLSTYGKNDANTTLIKYVIRTLMNGEVPKLTKCEQIWDYIYSRDCARALIAVGQKGMDGKAYPIGNGTARRLSDYVEDIRAIINPNSPIDYGAIDYYPDQPMILCADISELTSDTGFKPETVFRDGIKQIVKHMYPEFSYYE
jgi:nucleoside-diphosphate-sugar epimerase